MKFCAEHCSTIPLEEKGIVYLLSPNQAVSECMVEFIHLQCNPRDCSSVLNLLHLDKILHSIIDRFQDNLTMYMNDYRGKDKFNQPRIRKGGIFPKESCKILSKLLSTATSKILNGLLSAFQAHLSNNQSSMQFELLICQSED